MTLFLLTGGGTENMRNFELEIHFSKWEFNAKYHMTASDSESMSMEALLAMGTAEDVSVLPGQRRACTRLCA